MLSKIINFVFPNECLGCEKTGSFLCQECLSAIPLRENIKCFFCGKDAVLGRSCQACQEEHGLERVIAIAPYTDSLVAKLIYTFKYNFVEAVGQALASIVSKGIEENKILKVLALENAAIVPIPLHSDRLKFRGFNQSEILAIELTKIYPSLNFSNLLKRSEFSFAQKEANKEERWENMRGVFELSEDAVIPETVILIDDVATSGSTLSSAAQALKKAGVRRIIGLTVAHEDYDIIKS